MIFNFQPINWLLITITNLVGLLLTFWVYFADRKKSLNKGFALFIIPNLMWINFYNLAFLSSSSKLSLLLTRLTFSSVFIFFIGFYYFFIIWFLGERGKYIIIGRLVVVYEITFAFLCTFTDIIIKSHVMGKWGITPIFSLIGNIAFHFPIIILVAIVLTKLIIRYQKSYVEERGKIKYFLFGVSLFVFVNLIIGVILPFFFKVYDYYFVTNYISIVLLSLVAYAIVKQGLFGIKVILTQALILTIGILLLWQTIVAIPNWLEFSWKLILFLLFIIFGSFLIKSVKREIKQREEIEKLNKEIERAYVFEKKAKEDVSRAYDVERRANTELQKLDKVKNDFLLTTQHDLRKPLTSVKWFLDMLIKGMLGKQTKKTLEGARNVQISVDDSIEEVNDFLDMAQFQMGKAGIVLKPAVDILPILNRISAKMKMRAEQNEVIFTFEGSDKPILTDADPVKLKAALANVVDNSIKYSPKGKVDMNVALTNEEKSVLITVKDTGIGIPKDKLKTIFEEMFERTEDAKRTTSMGKGIGLPLSTQIIKDHKGKIWAESEGEGKGSTFYIELPVSFGNTAAEATPKAPEIKK